MNHIFTNYLTKGWLIIYMDNLLVHSVNLEEHILCVQLVLQCLCEHKLGIKLEKCIFCTFQAEYLGLIVGEGWKWGSPSLHLLLENFRSG